MSDRVEINTWVPPQAPMPAVPLRLLCINQTQQLPKTGVQPIGHSDEPQTRALRANTRVQGHVGTPAPRTCEGGWGKGNFLTGCGARGATGQQGLVLDRVASRHNGNALTVDDSGVVPNTLSSSKVLFTQMMPQTQKWEQVYQAKYLSASVLGKNLFSGAVL